MTDSEWKQWMAVTENSQHQWTEDEITRRNGRGALYYLGGEDGVYIRIQPEGKLSVGTYEGALPHIGEAVFTRKAVMDCAGFDQAFQKAAELAGSRFLRDLLSDSPSQEVAMTYYPIDEILARRAKSMNSFSGYVEGSATAEYRAAVDQAAELAEQQKRKVDPIHHERIDRLLDAYARKLAENINKQNEIAARVPSILIAGRANFAGVSRCHKVVHNIGFPFHF